MKGSLLSLALTLMALLSVSSMAAGIWVKGNTHAHTTHSDGNASPEQVRWWYADHGYNFVVLTDHNTTGEVVKADRQDFIVIPGEEVSASFGGKPVHVNSLGSSTKIAPATGAGMPEAIENNIDAVIKAGGIPQVNHPNWRWAFDHRALSRVKHLGLLEVFNASSGCDDNGDVSHIPTEQIWDILLSLGMNVYGVATDDAHNYTDFSPQYDNPGRAWIWVHVVKLSQSEVLKNIKAGNFYSSTGIELAELSFDGKRLKITLKPKDKLTYCIRFIGKHGQILKETDGASAACELADTSPHAYIRAKAIASDGTVAWTQAFRR